MSLFPLGVRQAARRLWKTPGFTLAVLLTLGLGIGLNAAIFSVVYGILLRPLDVPEPDRMVMVWQDMTGRDGEEREWTGRGVFSDWREQARGFEGMTAFITFPADLTEGEGGAEQVPGLVTSHEYFSVVGVEPAIGRGFLPEEEEAGKHLVAVLSHGLWQRRFGGEESILGTAIQINGAAQTVVGIMPEGFRAPLEPDVQLWAPVPVKPKPKDHGYSYLRVLGRLEPGVALPAAEQEMDRVAAALREEYPDALRDVGASVQPLLDAVVGPTGKLLSVLYLAVTLVLLAACVNVAGLTLARATRRAAEMGIRTALGASRRQLATQLFGEALLLALGGGLLGLGLGAAFLAVLRAAAPADTPRLDAVRLDPAFFGYALVISLLAALLIGALPALSVARRGGSTEALRSGRGATDGGRSRRWRSALVGLQVAFGLVLLVGAGLLGRSLYNLARVDLGFEPEGVSLGRIALAPERYPEEADMTTFITELERGLESRPDIESAAVVSALPLADGVGERAFVLDGRAAAPGEETTALFRAVSPGFFDTLGLRRVDGQLLGPGDTAGGNPVAVVNESFVRRFLDGGPALGHKVHIDQIDDPEGPGRTIVGVVADLRGRSVDEPAREEIFTPLAQTTSSLVTVAVRGRGASEAALAAIREEVARVRADQVVAQLSTMEEVVGEKLAPRRFAALLIALFAAAVLVLVATGLYGVLQLAVAERRREIAIRLAMGASRGSVMGLVMRWSALIVLGGLAVGVALVVAGHDRLAELLYEVEGLDPVTVAAMVLLLALVALAATFLPARRALRLDPAVTLRDGAA